MWQLDQARTGQYTDFHPPFMSWVWSVLNRLIPGSGGMFLLHSFLFWSGLSMIYFQAIRSLGWAAAVTLSVGLSPPLLAALGMIVKDLGMVSALLAAIGALLLAERRRAALVLAWFAVFYAVAVRHNAILAAPPLAIWMGMILTRRLRIAAKHRIAASVAAGICIVASIMGTSIAVTAMLIRPEKGFNLQAILLHDITGVSIRTGTSYLPSFYARGKRPLSIEEIEQVYRPETSYWLLWGDPGVRRPGFIWDKDEFSALWNAWITSILSHPSEYLEHRWGVFRALLGIGVHQNWPYWFPSEEEIRKSGGWNAGFKAKLTSMVMDTRNWPVYRAWFYLAIIGAACSYAALFGPRHRPAFLAILASALLYEAGYFFAAPSPDFRYSWWLMLAALILPALLRPVSLRSPPRRPPACPARATGYHPSVDAAVETP